MDLVKQGRITLLGLLSQLLSKMEGNDKLEELLLDAVGDEAKLAKLKSELGMGGSNG